jgi:hypothetical protein
MARIIDYMFGDKSKVGPLTQMVDVEIAGVVFRESG